PLHYATIGGNLPIVKYLVQSGANLEAKSPGGLTPLHHAAYEGYLPIVEYLLKEGAHYTSRTKSGKTPKDLARQKGHVDIVKLLQIYEDNVISRSAKLFFAVENGNAKEVQRLIEQEGV